MKLVLLVVGLAFALAAQTPNVLPADQVFSAAKEIKDPAQRAEAFRTFLADYPASRSAQELAGREMVDAAIAASPGNASKAIAMAKDVLRPLVGVSQAHVAAQFAAGLAEANLSLPNAEQFARQALQALTYEDFRPRVLASPAARRHTPPESSIQNQFAVNQAKILNTLGTIEVKEGKTAEGRDFLEQSLRKDPYSTETAYALAALSAGDQAQELRFITEGYLAHPKKADRIKLEALYSASHNNSLSGLEEYLDEQYVKLLPRPAALEPYHGTPKRTVLLELLTGSACPPCLGMDMAFDQLLERYSRNELVVLMYHQNRAGPDPMTNYAALNRFAYYSGVSAPTVILAGNVELGGGFAERASEFATRLSGDVDAQLAIPAGVQLHLNAALKGRDIPVRVDVGAVENSSAHLTLRLVVVDKLLRYSGETGVRFHPMVVRTVAEYPLRNAGAKSIHHSFNLDKILAEVKKYHDDYEKHPEERFNIASYNWPVRLETVGANGLAVAAFVQDDTTKQILQAAWADVSPAHSVKERHVSQQ